MNIKNAICPCCGRLDYFSPLKNENFKNTIELDEEIPNVIFNENINNFFSFSIESKIKCSNNEAKHPLNNNSYNMYKFNFSIISDKNISIQDENKIIKQKGKNQNKNAKKSKKLGRRTKRDSGISLDEDNTNTINNQDPKVHDKFSDDNMRKKCKNVILKTLLRFINNKIKILYDNDLGHGDLEKSLKVLNQKEKKRDTLGYNRIFIDKKLKDIFSEKISARFCNYSLDHNKKIINSLINEEDEEKKIYFSKLFDLTFMECLKYFRGDIDIKELEGFQCLPTIKEELLKKNGEKYTNHFEYYIKNYETLINKRAKKIKKDSVRNTKYIKK